MSPKKKEKNSAVTDAEEDGGFPSEESFKAQLEKNPDGNKPLLHNKTI